MQKIRNGLIAMFMLVFSVTSAEAQVSIGIGLPNVSIGINLPLYPGTRPGAGLSGLLRSTGGCQLFLLRRHVLGLPGR